MHIRNVIKRFRDLRYSLTGSPIKENIAFIHIPKCAGTTISQGVEKFFLSPYVVELNAYAALETAKFLGSSDAELRLNTLTYELMNPPKTTKHGKFVTGHWRCNKKTISHFPNWFFMTILRNPENRFLSHFFFNRALKDSHYKIPEEMSLSEFLETKSAENLKGTYIKNFTNRSEVNNDAINEACEVLERMNLIGIVENLNAFVNSFKRKFGADLPLKMLNKNPVPYHKQKKEFSLSDIQKIKEICKPDQIVYQHALNLTQKSC